MSCLIVGQRAAFGSICATIVQPEFQRYIGSMYAHHERKRSSILGISDLPTRRSEVSRSVNTRASTVTHPPLRLESDQLAYLCQVMVIVLGNKIQMIHEPHGLLETRMQARSRKNVRFKCPQMLH